MRSHGGLDQPSPELMVYPCLLRREAGQCREQRRVEHRELRARTALAHRVARILRYTGEHASPGEQVEIVGERRGVARVVEPAQHLRVREHLSRIAAAQLEESPEQ